MNDDFMPGDSFRSIVARLQKENGDLINLYKTTVALLAFSAVLNCLLLFQWLWATMSK